MTPAYALCFHASLDGPETLRLTRISHVYATERAQVAEGQDSKWPDESVTLGKFHPRVGGGSKMSAGKFVVIALTWRDNAQGGREIVGKEGGLQMQRIINLSFDHR